MSKSILIIGCFLHLVLSAGCDAENRPQEIFLSRALGAPEVVQGSSHYFIGYLGASDSELTLYARQEAIQIGNVYESAYLEIEESKLVTGSARDCIGSLVSVEGKLIITSDGDQSLVFPVAIIQDIKNITVIGKSIRCYDVRR